MLLGLTLRWNGGNLVGLLLYKRNNIFRVTREAHICFEITSCVTKNWILSLEMWNVRHRLQLEHKTYQHKPAKWNLGNWNPFSNFYIVNHVRYDEVETHATTNTLLHNDCVLPFTQLLNGSAFLSFNYHGADIKIRFKLCKEISYNIIVYSSIL
jgi:hypothetical protein